MTGGLGIHEYRAWGNEKARQDGLYTNNIMEIQALHNHSCAQMHSSYRGTLASTDTPVIIEPVDPRAESPVQMTDDSTSYTDSPRAESPMQLTDDDTSYDDSPMPVHSAKRARMMDSACQTDDTVNYVNFYVPPCQLPSHIASQILTLLRDNSKPFPYQFV
jgi:hypothetical protein